MLSAFGVDHGEVSKGFVSGAKKTLGGAKKAIGEKMELKAPNDPTRGTYNNLRLAVTPLPRRPR